MLQKIVDLCLSLIGAKSIFRRLGGDRFGIMMLDKNVVRARKVAKNFSMLFERLTF